MGECACESCNKIGHLSESTVNDFPQDLKKYYEASFPIYNTHATLIPSHRPADFIELVVLKREKSDEKEDLENRMMQRVRGKVPMQKKFHIDISQVGLIGDLEGNQEIKHAKAILVEGAPGVGKTTFAWQLCKMWQSGEVLKEWSVVIMIQLRSIQGKMIKHLADVFHGNKDVTNFYRSGNKVFIIFDGYDEANEEQRRQDSVIQNILRRELLPEATILITARLSSILPGYFEQKIDQHIELFGFSKEMVQSYITAVCEEEKKRSEVDLRKNILDFLNSNPYVSSAVFLPLHCAMVVSNFVKRCKFKQEIVAPKTLTDMYKTLVLGLVNHELLQDHKVAFNDYNELPKNVLDLLMKLGEFAAKGLSLRQFWWLKKDIPFNKKDLMGLMHEVNDAGLQYYFIHSTVQEYLAALYWSWKFTPHELNDLIINGDLFPLKVFLTEGNDSDIYFWPALMFLAGMGKLKNVKIRDILEDLKRKECPNIDDEEEMFLFKKEYCYHFLSSLCSLLYESQDDELIQATFDGALLETIPSNPVEMFTTGYCIAKHKMETLWRTGFDEMVIESDYLEYLVKGISFNQPTTGLKAKIHYLIIKAASFEVCGKLLQKVNESKIAESLSWLNIIVDQESDEDIISTLGKLPQMFKSLEVLMFNFNKFNRNSLINFFYSILPKFPSLVWLYLHVDSKGTLACEPIRIPGLRRLAYINCYFPQLALFNIDRLTLFTVIACSLELSDFEDIADIVKVSKVLKTLQIVRCNMVEPSTCKFIASAVSQSSCLKRLIIIKCHIGVVGAKEFANAIAASNSLYEVNIYDDSIQEDGALALTNAIYASEYWRGLTLFHEFNDCVYALFLQSYCSLKPRVGCPEDLDDFLQGKSVESNMIPFLWKIKSFKWLFSSMNLGKHIHV